MADYYHYDYQCPFISSTAQNKIYCDGNCRIEFMTGYDCKEFLQKYCANMDQHWRNCTIAQQKTKRLFQNEELKLIIKNWKKQRITNARWTPIEHIMNARTRQKTAQKKWPPRRLYMLRLMKSLFMTTPTAIPCFVKITWNQSFYNRNYIKQEKERSILACSFLSLASPC